MDLKIVLKILFCSYFSK